MGVCLLVVVDAVVAVVGLLLTFVVGLVVWSFGRLLVCLFVVVVVIVVVVVVVVVAVVVVVVVLLLLLL